MAVVAAPLVAQRDAIRWVSDEIFNQSPYVANMVFSGSAVKTSTPPTGAKFVKLTTTANVYFSLNGTAAVPVADVTDGSGSQLLSVYGSEFYSLDGSTAVSVAAGGAAVVSLVYYL